MGMISGQCSIRLVGTRIGEIAILCPAWHFRCRELDFASDARRNDQSKSRRVHIKEWPGPAGADSPQFRVVANGGFILTADPDAESFERMEWSPELGRR